ncbi:phosphatidylinositol-glycan biosynthesis class W protein-like [Galleria mellonella]|uniref:Phosphatidylinositol-glycan biosynthesis class W protein n=1 Tax=Galleria mellonella TaxID=7137 RepID=A0A6J1WIC2_GALME|nr:phosphatidylinositol-glycan biosynthesis class W protein-like [Galleria mellonella]
MQSQFRHDLLTMNSTEYKKYHESLMMNNHGSPVFHTFLCIFFTVQCSLYCSIVNRYSGVLQYVYEYIIIVLPMIAALTIISEYIYILNIAVFTILLYEFIYQYKKLDLLKKFKQYNRFKTGRIHTISAVRGLTYLITVFCILAVDFEIFPRYLAKTEKYGYSLMDTGVGLFVFMSGLVHKDVAKNNVMAIIKGNTKFISILVCLGVARFISVKQLDYQEHVTEYGVHWNFFFTLAVCKLLSSVLLFYSNSPFYLSIIVIVLHETALYVGLQDWVFGDTPRINVLDANREGITSSLGYVSLYLFSAHIKVILVDKTIHRYKVQAKLILNCLILWIMTYIVNFYRPTSRTLANTGYCLYIEAIIVTIIALLYFHEVLFQNFDVPVILSTVNDNGLLYFLIANLITGAINLNIRTMLVSTPMTLIILNNYMVVTTAFTAYLKKIGVKI